MNFDVKDIDGKTLHAFYASFGGWKTFLQNEKYAQFREKISEKVHRKGIFFDGVLIGIAVVTYVKARRGTYLMCSHGPLIAKDADAGVWEFFYGWYAKYGKEMECDFVRYNALVDPKIENDLMKSGYRPAPVYMANPECTLLLDIAGDVESICAQMKKTTRYEVRKSQKGGIDVTMGNGEKDLEVFWNLHEKTFARKKFTPFAKKNTELELNVFGDDAQIFSAYVDGEPMASSLMIFDDKTVYYHQGASVRSKQPVAHATLWAAVLEAKKRGCKTFNLWGVSEAENKAHPWFGLSKFKRGFGGQEIRTMHVHDKPLTWKYWINWSVETWRRRKRGY
jgi:lipid II:glycine glycyltransferase (peptidoglycan interpeptide bridge formation enzyme)